MIYFVSDYHWNHNKDFIYRSRGFSSVEEMNREIVKRHNEIVHKDDKVFILGDLCLGGASEDVLAQNKELIESLNGSLFLIKGNHDSEKRCQMYKTCRNVFSIDSSLYYDYGGYHFYLSHFPTITSNFDFDKPLRQRLINLCGHSHCKNAFEDWNRYNAPIYHCELDAHDCYPLSVDIILMNIENKLKEGN